MVQLPRLCMLLPVAEWPFSSNSAFVEGRLKYVVASSSFLASACGFGYAVYQRASQTVTSFFHDLLFILLLTIIFVFYFYFVMYFNDYPYS